MIVVREEGKKEKPRRNYEVTDRILYSIKLANYITDLQRNDGFENWFYLAECS